MLNFWQILFHKTYKKEVLMDKEFSAKIADALRDPVSVAIGIRYPVPTTAAKMASELGLSPEQEKRARWIAKLFRDHDEEALGELINIYKQQNEEIMEDRNSVAEMQKRKYLNKIETEERYKQMYQPIVQEIKQELEKNYDLVKKHNAKSCTISLSSWFLNDESSEITLFSLFRRALLNPDHICIYSYPHWSANGYFQKRSGKIKSFGDLHVYNDKRHNSHWTLKEYERFLKVLKEGEIIFFYE